MYELRVSVRLVVTVAAAVVRRDHGWIDRPKDREFIESNIGQGLWTADTVWGVITNKLPIPEILASDEETADAAIAFVSSLPLASAYKSDARIKTCLSSGLNYKVPESEIGVISQVMALYLHRDKYKRRDEWRLISNSSKHVGYTGGFLDPYTDLRIRKRIINQTSYLSACQCSQKHSKLEKAAGICPTTERKTREVLSYQLVDSGCCLYSWDPDKRAGDPMNLSVGDVIPVRSAQIKNHGLCRPPKGGSPAKVTKIVHVEIAQRVA